MSITYPRLVAHGRAPRNTLWCRAGVRALIADPATHVSVAVGDALVPARDPALAQGQILVRPEPTWRWPNDEPDAVGEIWLSRGDVGLSAVGWWSPAVVTGRRALTMHVAGLTLWSGAHRICTEEHARIDAVLGDEH